MNLSISVVIPVYNEEKNIGTTVFKVASQLNGIPHEIIIVNDGSTDGTQAVLEALRLQYPQIRIVRHLSNAGYGAALRSGCKEARNEYVFLTDGDNQFTLKELPAAISLLSSCDLVIGYRKRKKYEWHRRTISWLYTCLVNLFFTTSYTDINCAFKLFRRDLLVAHPLISDGAFISAEILLRANTAGHKYMEIGVEHTKRIYGTSHGATFKVILTTIREMIRYYFKKPRTLE